MPSIATKKKERNLPDKKKMSYMKVDIIYASVYMERVSEQDLFERMLQYS